MEGGQSCANPAQALMAEGFSNWSRRDFQAREVTYLNNRVNKLAARKMCIPLSAATVQAFIKAAEKWGRDDLDSISKEARLAPGG